MDIIKCNGMASSSSAGMFMSQSLAHDGNLQDESQDHPTYVAIWYFTISVFSEWKSWLIIHTWNWVPVPSAINPITD